MCVCVCVCVWAGVCVWVGGCGCGCARARVLMPGRMRDKVSYSLQYYIRSCIILMFHYSTLSLTRGS